MRFRGPQAPADWQEDLLFLLQQEQAGYEFCAWQETLVLGVEAVGGGHARQFAHLFSSHDLAQSCAVSVWT
jgi:hypothetical protein